MFSFATLALRFAQDGHVLATMPLQSGYEYSVRLATGSTCYFQAIGDVMAFADSIRALARDEAGELAALWGYTVKRVATNEVSARPRNSRDDDKTIYATDWRELINTIISDVCHEVRATTKWHVYKSPLSFGVELYAPGKDEVYFAASLAEVRAILAVLDAPILPAPVQDVLQDAANRLVSQLGALSAGDTTAKTQVLNALSALLPNVMLGIGVTSQLAYSKGYILGQTFHNGYLERYSVTTPDESVQIQFPDIRILQVWLANQ